MAEASRTDDKSIIKEARERFKRCVDAESANRKLRLDDRRFYAGDSDNGFQWPDEWAKKRRGENRPCLTINKLPQHIKQVANDVRQNRPQGKVRGVDDRSDPETAEIIAGVCRHIENNSNADYAYDTAVENTAIDGLGYWRILTDYVDDETLDQELFIRRIRNTFTVYLDPEHTEPDGSDAKFGFISVMIPKESAKAKLEASAVAEWGEDQRGAPDWYSATHVRGAEYFCIKYTEREVSGTNGKTRKARVPQVHWYKLVGNRIVDRGETPFRWVPLVKILGEEIDIDGEVTIKGMVRNAKDSQRQYNVSRSAVVERNGLATKAPWTAPADAIAGFENEWKNANRDSLSVLPWNHRDEQGELIPQPTRVAPPDVPAGFVQDAMIASDDLKSTMGQYDASLGAKSNEQSGRAILARQREGDVATFNYADNLARGIRHTYRILIDAIPKVYDTARLLRIIGEDGEEQRVRIDPTQQEAVLEEKDATGKAQKIYNLGIGRYDVVVTVGPSYTTKRQEATEAMTTLIQASPNLMGVIGDLYVKGQDWTGADEMAKRLRATLVPEVRALVEADDDAELPPQARLLIDRITQQAQGMAQQMQAVQQAAAKEVAQRDQRIEQLSFQCERERLAKEQAQLKATQADVERQITESKATAQQEVAQLLQGGMQQRAELGAQQESQVLVALGQIGQGVQALMAGIQQMAASQAEYWQLMQTMAAQQAEQTAMLQALVEQSTRPRQWAIKRGKDGLAAGFEQVMAPAAPLQ